MPTLDVRLLGQFHVTYGGEPVETLSSPRLQSLLAYLLLHRGTPLSRQQVAFLFWPDSTEAQARTNLRKALYDLRQALPDADAFVHSEGQTIGWVADAPHRLDVTPFEAALDRVEEIAGSEDRDDSVQALAQAVDLYAGDLLPSCYDDWVLPERERLRTRYLRGLERLTELLEEAGDHTGAIEQTQRLLRDEPLHEPGHRRLMRLLATSGQRALALAQYEQCARLLDEELGVEPEAETKRLYEQIRDGELAAREEQTETQQETRPHLHNLPAPLTPLIGRRAELAELESLLEDPACRLVTLSGPGGSGKTRLALEAATQQVGRYRHGVYLVGLAGTSSVDAIVPTVAEAIGFPLYGGKDPLEQMLEFVRQREMLLVLDNFEHLLTGSRIVVRILETAPGVQILATSRSELGLSGEQVYPVEGLDVPGPDEELEEVARYSAVRLFVASARRLRPDFELTGGNAAGVTEACRLVEGMPLGLMLAAAWVELLAPDRIAAEIKRDLDLLEADWPDVPARQHSMRAVFDHSWELLSAQERTVLAALSVFRGGFGQDAAGAVADADLRDLRLLVRKSLVQRVEGDRYHVHELLRQYAAERLEGMRGSEAAHSRHTRYYAAALGRWGDELEGSCQLDALAEMDLEIGNARAAWDWAVERELGDQLQQAMDGLCRYYEWRGRHQEGAAVCEALLEGAVARASCDGVRLRARALAWQSAFSGAMGRPKTAVRELEDAVALLAGGECDGHDVRGERAFVLRQMGHFAREMLDHSRARELYEESLALCRATGDQWRMADVLTELSWLASQMGAWAQAERYAQRGLAIRRSLGDRVGMSVSLRTLSHLALYQGRLGQAEQCAQASVDTSREMGDHRGVSYGLGYLGYAQIAQGKFDEARKALEESVAIARDRVVVRPRLFLELYLAVAKVHLGMYGEAQETFLDACAASGEGVPWGARQFADHGLAMIAIRDGAYSEADRLLSGMIRDARAGGGREWMALGLGTLALVRPHTKAIEARQDVAEALRVSLETEFPLPRLYALTAAAATALVAGDRERAVELHALALCHRFVADSRWFGDVVGRQIGAAVEALPAEAVVAAQERGRGRDLEATLRELLAEFAEP